MYLTYEVWLRFNTFPKSRASLSDMIKDDRSHYGYSCSSFSARLHRSEPYFAKYSNTGGGSSWVSQNKLHCYSRKEHPSQKVLLSRPLNQLALWNQQRISKPHLACWEFFVSQSTACWRIIRWHQIANWHQERLRSKFIQNFGCGTEEVQRVGNSSDNDTAVALTATRLPFLHLETRYGRLKSHRSGKNLVNGDVSF
jgi:hypothetical protein